ncbi:outer membrane beta-barrel protein [Spirosoma validum]|uniref:Outer membrane beta-barrel protein n=1 Tax=Spirosoma validum TaxID=2771355 RepID=A0A927B301_9BACT|nr:outer membrane beta-barrel protein [Spirosoma validum]MBD2754639.1 outer membrane beta-barrel protein [Spirosoma validum]
MRNYLAGVLMLVALSATAQEYKPFKVNLSIGYAKPFNAGVSGGFLVAVEPKYGLSDQFDLGLRLEVASVARGVQYNGNITTGDVGAYASYLITGNYLFTQGSVRPFIGAGVGLYTIGAAGTVVISNNGQPNQNIQLVSDTKFGGMIRAGIKAGHFVASVEYNAVPTTKNNSSALEVTSENAYLGIKIGADIGGGRR